MYSRCVSRSSHISKASNSRCDFWSLLAATCDCSRPMVTARFVCLSLRRFLPLRLRVSFDVLLLLSIPLLKIETLRSRSDCPAGCAAGCTAGCRTGWVQASTTSSNAAQSTNLCKKCTSVRIGTIPKRLKEAASPSLTKLHQARSRADIVLEN